MGFRHVLVALDGSVGAQHALSRAIDFAYLSDAPLTVLVVEGRLPAGAATVGEVEDAKRHKDRFFSKVAANAQERAEAAGIVVDVEIRAGRPAAAITRCARECGADVIVVGHNRHVWEDILVGSTADRVAHHADCPVMVVR
jgi:nucleotide-binding universal stress UspA family protein